MFTDRSALCNLLRRFEIPFDEVLDNNELRVTVEVDTADGVRMKGYSGFYARWVFNSDGVFNYMVIEE
jgi:hypothetical protein